MNAEDYTGPCCLPHEDGQHFWWVHECLEWTGPGQQRKVIREIELPLSDNGWRYNPETGTVEPSVKCWTCGTHGRWENGKWKVVP